MTGYAIILAGGALFLTNGIETYVSVIQSLDLSRPSIFIIKVSEYHSLYIKIIII